MLITALFHILGPTMETVAANIQTLAAGRFFSGVGAGAAIVIVPIFISEISPPASKGFFGASTQIMCNLGILASQILGVKYSTSQTWRFILLVPGTLGLLQIVGLILGGKESPKWLADHKGLAAGQRMLRILRGKDADIEVETKYWADQEVTAPAEEQTLLTGPSNNKTSNKHLGPWDVLVHGETQRSVLIVMTVMILQQATGICSVVMYGVDVLADLLAANSALLNVGVSGLNVVVTIAAAPLIDRFGRKSCLLLSVIVMGVASMFLGFGIMQRIPMLSGVSVLVFVAGFALGFGPVPFILASELVNSEAVGSTQSWALAASWISTFMVAQFFPMFNEFLGPGKVYFVFAAMAAVSALFFLTFLPESKGKTADETWGRKRISSERED